jgi:hypothetical protein
LSLCYVCCTAYCFVFPVKNKIRSSFDPCTYFVLPLHVIYSLHLWSNVSGSYHVIVIIIFITSSAFQNTKDRVYLDYKYVFCIYVCVCVKCVLLLCGKDIWSYKFFNT